MRKRILLLAIISTAAAVLALFVPASIALQTAHRKDDQIELHNEAFTAGYQFESTNALAGLDEHRFAIYDANGTLVNGDGPLKADVAVTAALAGKPTIARDSDFLITAVPLTRGRALRASERATAWNFNAYASVLYLGGLAVAMIGLAALAAVGLSRRINAPLADLAMSARRFGGGDFSVRATHSGLAEIDDVGTALNTTAERMSHLVSRERRLTAETSHQLRTPLAGMRVAIEAEASAPRDDPAELTNELLAAIDRMDAAISDLIALSRHTDRGGAPVSVADVLDRAAQRWKQAFRNAGRELTTHTAIISPSDGALLTGARPAAIDTVLDVLLDNSLAHGAGIVSIRLASISGSPVILLTDEGTFVGDDAADPFHNPPSPGDQHGFGLGIAQAFADAEGAQVRLTSRRPTSFELILPRADE